MMKHKQTHKTIALLLVLLLALGTVPMAFAQTTDSEPSTGIIYKGKSAVERWFFKGVDTTYTTTDLFTNYKNVMPGDTLTQDFIVKNESKNTIKLDMEIVPHDGVKNKLSPGVAQHTTTEQVIAFLNRLSLKVTAGEGEESRVLFAIPVGALGTYDGNATLGTLPAGYGTELQVALEIPIDLGNEFAFAGGNGIAELDFRFIVAEYEPGGGGGGGSTPPKDPEDPIIPSDPIEDIDDPEVPLGPSEEEIDDPLVPGGAPKTGDASDFMTPILLMLIAVCGIYILHRKEQKE